jgi:predicted amidohydrolase
MQDMTIEALMPSDSTVAWEEGNLLANGAFARATTGGLPEGWQAVCPNPVLAPHFQMAAAPGAAPTLLARGNGRRECFGYVRHPVQLDAGKTYRLRVWLEAEGLKDLSRHLVHGVFAEGYNDGILSYRRMAGGALGDQRFPGPQTACDAEVRLYFRFSARGRVWWRHVSLQECEPIKPRLVKVACSWGQGDLDYWSRWLDAAGSRGVDLALLPETFAGINAADAQPLDGPAATLMAAKARQWHMYVSGSIYERRGDVIYNTAPLFDRSGRLVGTYSKNMLYDPELDMGITPGTGLPVFQADFGKVGIIICYDSWFPETARLVAYKGAELVLFPNAGYYAGLMPARAADNGVWIAVSSLQGPAGVWDSSGTCAGEMSPEPTRFGPSSVLAFEKNHDLRLVTATLDLSRRYSPHYWGGPLRSAPGGRRVRQTLIQPIEAEISRQAQRWWEEGTDT